MFPFSLPCSEAEEPFGDQRKTGFNSTFWLLYISYFYNRLLFWFIHDVFTPSYTHLMCERANAGRILFETENQVQRSGWRFSKGGGTISSQVVYSVMHHPFHLSKIFVKVGLLFLAVNCCVVSCCVWRQIKGQFCNRCGKQARTAGDCYQLMGWTTP